MEATSALSLSPSLLTHSSRRLADIAARVVEELSHEENPYAHDDFTPYCEGFGAEIAEEDLKGDEIIEENDHEDDEDEFEFPIIASDWISCPSPADEIFYNGEILPVYPLFNTNLVPDGIGFLKQNTADDIQTPPPSAADKVVRLPLRILFKEDTETPSSSSSSEVDDLDGIPPGTYCVWKPKRVAEEVEGRWKKSGSTRFSKRWRLRDLLHRSTSDGSKDKFVFLTPLNGQDKRTEDNVVKLEKSKAVEKVVVAEQHHEKDGGERRRTSLSPHRLDLVEKMGKKNIKLYKLVLSA